MWKNQELFKVFVFSALNPFKFLGFSLPLGGGRGGEKTTPFVPLKGELVEKDEDGGKYVG